MNTITLCMFIVLGAQGWERPSIQEAELSAPDGIQPGAQLQARDPAENTESESWDLDSMDDAPKRDDPSEQQGTQQYYWVYDENGSPVARPVAGERQAEPPEPARTEAPERPAPARETSERSGSYTGRIATFWMVLPPR